MENTQQKRSPSESKIPNHNNKKNCIQFRFEQAVQDRDLLFKTSMIALITVGFGLFPLIIISLTCWRALFNDGIVNITFISLGKWELISELILFTLLSVISIIFTLYCIILLIRRYLICDKGSKK